MVVAEYRIGRIYLIRHGKPEFPYTNEPGRWISGREFNRLSELYSGSALKKDWNSGRIERHRAEILAAIRKSRPLSSDLLRARQTAELLLDRNEQIEVSEVFREVPLPTVPEILVLPAYWHLILARLLWYAGKSSDEPKTEALERARRAAEILEVHERHSPVSLFSHGFFLYILTKELIRRGWQCEETRPMKYLEIRSFHRKDESRKSS
ncbi:MAG: histidine phosphatase family protein [Leptospiraceae bacterium]|nr:histidine phosphatase family protein [Leptospiraceae bacterium]